MNQHWRWRSAVPAMVALLLATGCGATGQTDTKAGGASAPLVLTMGTDDQPADAGARLFDEFARQVDQLSNGKLRIELKWHAGGSGHPGWDQVIAAMVARGDLDLAVVPTRAWDTQGVTSLRALTAPFLVTSDALTDQILRSDLADTMLGGLDRAGVKGIGLVPEGLRHPFSFTTPLLGASDYAGQHIRAPKSDVTSAMFAVLGATADDYATDFAEQVARGQATAAESSFEWAHALPGPTTATGNVTFFPKVDAIVANLGAYDGLTEEQRSILSEAAAKTLDFAITNRPDEATLASEHCKDGGTVVLATSADIDSLEKSVQSVYDTLDADPTTRQLIADIRKMKDSLPSDGETVQACGPSSSATPSTAPAVEFPEGVYRTVLTSSAPEPGLMGVNTLTFHDGRWEHKDPEGGVCTGTYEVRGDRIHVLMPVDMCGNPAGSEVFNSTWTLQDGELRFTDPRSAIDGADFARALWGSQPWRKIG